MKNKKAENFFASLWKDYAAINPQAQAIQTLLTAQGESLYNDHVAFRTYQHPLIGIDAFEKPFRALGYVAKAEYHFKEKKLYARHYEMDGDTEAPKIFLSELKLKECSETLRKTVESLIQEGTVAIERVHGEEGFCWLGRPWDISHATYKELVAESEYAGWMGAFGFHANHFTVSINSLKKFKNITDLNRFLKEKGFRLNDSGGEVKGTPQVFLEQSSTLAHPIRVRFREGMFEIPGCYYEFAKRYPDSSGQLFQGFIEGSANKIFESTDASR